jgi:hypothetical protein
MVTDIGKVKAAKELLESVRTESRMRSADLNATILELENLIKLFENPNYMQCVECNRMVIHTNYRIKGWRSRCCNA